MTPEFAAAFGEWTRTLALPPGANVVEALITYETITLTYYHRDSPVIDDELVMSTSRYANPPEAHGAYRRALKGVSA